MRIRRDPAIGRLTKRPEFLAAASGRRFHTERLTIQGRPRDAAEAVEGLRVGFTVTKRVGGAVVRNRIRRRLRSAVSEAGLAFRASAMDVVVIGRHGALSAPFPVLIDDLSRGLDVVSRPKNASRNQPPKPAVAADGPTDI
ncbi:MAG: ribonuclease protein component [Enterovirga sp.]|nr:ribonuclease protein component [Enterovirga sp.]